MKKMHADAIRGVWAGATGCNNSAQLHPGRFSTLNTDAEYGNEVKVFSFVDT